jgi:hypothetical protein
VLLSDAAQFIALCRVYNGKVKCPLHRPERVIQGILTPEIDCRAACLAAINLPFGPDPEVEAAFVHTGHSAEVLL